MAGVNFGPFGTYKSTTAVTKDRFVIPVDLTTGVAGVKMPTAENQACTGIAVETVDADKYLSVVDKEGDTYWVEGDTSAAPGDQVIADADGKAKKAVAGGVPANFNIVGEVKEEKTVAGVQMCKVMLKIMSVYM